MAMANGEIIVDELLYFVTNSMKSKTSKKIVEIGTKFYAPIEITTLKDNLWEKVRLSINRC